MSIRLTLSRLGAAGAILASAAGIAAITAVPAHAALSCRDAVAFKVVDGKVYGMVRVQSGTRGGVYARVLCSMRDRT